MNRAMAAVGERARAMAASSASAIRMGLVRLRGATAIQSLRVEEALLRTVKNQEEEGVPETRGLPRSFLVVTDGVGCSGRPAPAAVLGVSNRMGEALVEGAAGSLQVIKRFSGGGSVVLDEDSVLCGLILGREDFLRTPSAQLVVAPAAASGDVNADADGDQEGPTTTSRLASAFFPRPVMRWSEHFYRRALRLAGADERTLEGFRVRENGEHAHRHAWGSRIHLTKQCGTAR